MKRMGALALVAMSLACRRSPPAAERSSASPGSAVAAGSAPVPADPCRIAGARMPLLARWSAAERDALEDAMRAGIAVLAADDCRGMRLLPACRARGRYGYMGAKPAAHIVDLATDEELRINAPKSDAFDAGSPPLHVDVTIVGSRATWRDSLTPGELAGDCARATHFVKSADIGAADKKACGAAHPGDVEPPAACKAIVALHTTPIAELEDLTTFDRAPEGAVLNIGVCPDGMVVSQRRCVKPPVNTPYLCAFGDAAGCREQCERGDVNSCDVLAFMLWHGKGVAKDTALAAARYTAACDRADPIACGNLGAFLHAGDGVPRDPAKAAALFDRACTLGDTGACGNLGIVYLSGDGVAADAARGLSLLQRACDAGSASACKQLIVRLRTGEGVAKDVPRAFALLGELCEANNGTACTELGRLTVLGDGVANDHPRGATLFDHGCRAGDDTACVMLALMYRQADGVGRDDVRATRLMDRACRRGNADGCHNLGIAYEHGKGVAPDARRAAQLYDQACTANVAAACMYLADFLNDGIGGAKDVKRAHALNARACELGEQKACAK